MDFKHFSHNYALVFHQVPQGSEIHCSGCKSPGSGNVYVCWSCNHFLHEQCYHAKRSLNHPSHALHPLTLVPYPTYQSGSFVCNSCNLGGNGFCYTCSECHFDIHVHCAILPNTNPQVSYFPIPNNVNNYITHPQTPIYPHHEHNYPPTQNNIYPCFPQNVVTSGSNNQNNNFHPPYIQSHTPPQNYNPPVNPPYPNPPPHPTTSTGGSINQNNQFPSPYPQPNTHPSNYNPTVNTPYSNTPPQPMPTIPIYSTVVTPTATNNSPPCYPTGEHQNTNNPQSNPPSAIKHFSHPHTLKQTELHQKVGIICSACDCKLSGLAFVCTEPHCTFNLHKACFDSPQEICHKSHPSHPLKLTTSSTYNNATFTCNACHKDGEAYTYTCTTCSYNIHVDCAIWPEKKSRPDHKHALTLYYSSPVGHGSKFYCDGCNETVHESAWMYYCRGCDFGFHLECVDSEIKPQSVLSSAASDMDELYEAAVKARIHAYSNQAILDLWRF